MMKTMLLVILAAVLACCSTSPERISGSVSYEERTYGPHGPLRVEDIHKMLRKETIISGTIDLATRELHQKVSEPQPWGLPKGPVPIRHSSDLWRIRRTKIGYLNLFLIRGDTTDGTARLVRKQLGENGELYPDHPDLLKYARDGDLILGMRGF